jgi:hypothetical protein
MRVKEEQIMWQNQSHLARQWFADCGVCPDLLDICLVTDVLVEFCQQGPTKEVKNRMETMKQYIKNKYGKEV